MCGICGIIGSPVDPVLLQRMNDSIIHRGPDDQGNWHDSRVGLAMRRLSIIDLKKGHQPLTNEDDSVIIVYNGELYNYRPWRDELIKKGHRFKTDADTETLLHLYEEYGIDFLSKLDGMFAFAIHDLKRNQVLLAIDRYGIKPLYYTIIDNQLFFCSEIKGLLTIPAIRKSIDPIALENYFSYYYINAPHTIFEGIHKLEPGHCLTINTLNGTSEMKEWFRLDYQKKTRLPVNEVKERIVYYLTEAIRKQLQSDVPVGVCLSGGLDSTAILSLMVKNLNYSVKAFTIGFDENSYNELNEAGLVAKKFGAQHYSRIMKPQDVSDRLATYIEAMDQPQGDWSGIANLVLSELAAEHVKVVLRGDGGDEFWGGYPTIVAFRAIRIWRKLPAWLRNYLVPKIIDSLPVSHQRLSFDFKVKRFLLGARYPDDRAHYGFKEIFNSDEKNTLYSHELKRRIDTYQGYQLYENALDKFNGTDWIDRLMHYDLRVFNAGCTLPVSDATTMRYSLEGRVPFYDNELVDFSLSLPTHLKVKGAKTKYVFRQALESILPRDIIKMKKKGFIIPLAGWIKGPLKEFVGDYLNAAHFTQSGIINPAFVQQIFQQHIEQKTDRGRQLSALVSLSVWLERYTRNGL